LFVKYGEEGGGREEGDGNMTEDGETRRRRGEGGLKRRCVEKLVLGTSYTAYDSPRFMWHLSQQVLIGVENFMSCTSAAYDSPWVMPHLSRQYTQNIVHKIGRIVCIA